MLYLADLHVHSRFSRAVSPSLDLSTLHASAQRKGLTVLGTGDFTHPAWRAELAAELLPAEPGLYRLRPDLAAAAEASVPQACRGPVRFVLQAEISTIYKAGDRVRKVHHVVLAPTLEAAASLSAALERIGNLASDGRPILGLDSRDLLELVLERCPGGCLIPAHLWTPWFSALGSKSGFDSVEACYRDLADHIFAVETGLSSDPPMNWRVSSLDRFALVSNSDAHSAGRLGRECNRFDGPLSFEGMVDALRSRDPSRFLGTVEFFPEEGKYHLDGHRKCGVRLDPAETIESSGLCPVCGRKVTVGVLSRVEALADRPRGAAPAPRPSYRRLVGLAETVGHALGRGAETVAVARKCDALLEELGPELFLLESADGVDLERAGGALLAEAIRRVRAEEVRWQAGFDGEFGTFELFSQAERDALTRQMVFFSDEAPRRGQAARGRPGRQTAPREEGTSEPPPLSARPSLPGPGEDPLLAGLGAEQLLAASAPGDRPLLVVAGPGTGKTRTLTARIAARIGRGALAPAGVLALTFTTRAAGELRERLASALGEERCQGLRVQTFHALGLALLRRAGRWRDRIADEAERLALAEAALARSGAPASRIEAARAADRLACFKNGSAVPEGPADEALLAAYEGALEAAGAMDLDDLVLKAAELLEDPIDGAVARAGTQAVFVDEYQDLSPAQVRLLRGLVGEGVELTAIGDPDQAIYAFRGADPRCILEFERDWPGARVLALGRSYRSSDTILEAASSVIARAKSRPRPRLWSGLAGEPHVVTLTASDGRAEAERIALAVERVLGGTSLLAFDSGAVDAAAEGLADSFSDVAVLYRLRSMGEPIAEALGRLGLPVQMGAPSAPFVESAAVRRVVAVLRAAAGRATPSDLSILVTGEELRLVGAAEVAANAGETSAEALLELVVDRLGLSLDEGLGPLRRAARSLSRLAPPRLGATGLAAPPRPVDGLVDWVSLHGDPDLGDPRADRITLSTIHAAKGLEWKVVFVAGCEEGLLPYRRPGSGPADVDEERRLFFVAMTRAERLLVLSRAKERPLHGSRGRVEPSRFLLDIEARLLRAEEGPAPRRRAGRARQLDLFAGGR